MDEATLARKAAEIGYEKYGTPGALAAGAGAMVGYRLAKDRIGNVSDDDTLSEAGAYAAVMAALKDVGADAETDVGAESDVGTEADAGASDGSRSGGSVVKLIEDLAGGGSGGGDGDHVSPDEGVDVPIDGDEQ